MEIAYLVVNGKVNEKWLKKELKGKTPIFCTDGAIDKLKSIKVEAVLGDLDSAKTKGKNYIHLPDQSYTDFEKALMHLEGKFDTIVIYGVSGGLMDHSLSNLSIAKVFCKKIQLLFKEPNQEFLFADKNLLMEKVKGKTISLIPFPVAEKVSTKGLKWPLKDDTLEIGNFISARNYADLDKVEITYKKGCLLVFVESN